MNTNTKMPLFPKVTVASSFTRRLRGLLGRDPEPKIMLITPCHSIHTRGMRYPINIAFFDADGLIVHAETNIEPGTKRSCVSACGVLEIPTEAAQGCWFKTGDHLRMAPPR